MNETVKDVKASPMSELEQGIVETIDASDGPLTRDQALKIVLTDFLDPDVNDENLTEEQVTDAFDRVWVRYFEE